MNERAYRRILEELEKGRRALRRARLTAGALRFVGVALATLAGLVLWMVLQKTLRVYSVPLAAGASLLGAAILVFSLVRWIVVPLIRMPDGDGFVAMVERRFPKEKNLIVNAYQLGNPARESQGEGVPDLVDALLARASKRVGKLDLRRWRDPRPDRPYLWAGGGALGALVLLAVLSPTLLTGALGQMIRPSLAQPPEVTLAVLPGDREVDRGSDVPISVEVTGTGGAPSLRFRERNGAWRTRGFSPRSGEPVTANGGTWETLLPDVDRFLEYRVDAPRAVSDVFTIRVREIPRLAGFRAHLTYPGYTGLPTETLSSGTGDLSALVGTTVDLRVLVNRPMPEAYLDWRPDGAAESERIDLEPADATTWRTQIRMMEPASYAVVVMDDDGPRLRSPRYRVDPAADRPPHLTLHFPQEDHDLADDMMERVVADAADDFGFSAVRIRYRIDDGNEASVPYTPFTAGQKEFRLDTLWDLNGLDLLPGMVVSYYLEVRDNDTVSGPKAVRSPVRRIRFPDVSELYEDVAEDHDTEIGNLTDVQESQRDLRDRLEKLSTDLKRGRELNWELRKDMEQTLNKQVEVEDQISEVVERLQETLNKAANRAQMSQDLVQKMSEINDLLENLANDELKRSFRELSRALERMDRNAIRRALENFNVSQEQMLRGMDRTIELLKQIRREEQMEDVARRTEEIARLQEEVAAELEKLGMKPEDLVPAGAEDLETADPSEPSNRDQDMEESEQTGENEADRQRQAESESENEASQSEATNEDADASEKSAESPQGESAEAQSSSEEARQGDDAESENTSQSSEEAEQQDDKTQSHDSSDQSSQAEQNSSSSAEQKAKLAQLAQQQKEAEAMLEELKRLLRTLKKLNQDQPEMANNMEELAEGETSRNLKQNMEGAEQNLSQGNQQKAAPFAFRARDEATRLADQARGMQSQMMQQQQDQNVEAVERIIHGLIDVSQVEEDLARTPEDTRVRAQRQMNLTESTEALAESLAAVMKQSFAVGDRQQSALDKAITNMGRATDLFEQGNQHKAEHQARESVSDVNEAIVQLMASHNQMCGGQGGGSASAKMQGLSQGQQSLNDATKKLLEKLAGKERMSMTDTQRMQQLAAQQEMIRQGLEELRESFEDTNELLGDLDRLTEDMQEVEQDLQKPEVDPRIKDRQQQILSRLLDAQRSIRQQEMSPRRQSKTGTLAARPSPPPLPDEMLRRERTLEEDVLRGADDRYPSQYRKLVEDYFRALSRESQSP